MSGPRFHLARAERASAARSYLTLPNRGFELTGPSGSVPFAPSMLDPNAVQASPSLRVALALAGALFPACTSVSAPPPAAAQRARSADGVSIAWEERGAGAPALVFVHGWCGERGFWRGTLEAVAPRHRCIALDLAGHGASGAGRTRWTLAAMAQDVVAVVEASGAEDVILVGHSMGAPVALLAAPRLAPRVRGVIAVDSLHRADFSYPPGFLQRAAGELEADFPRALSASMRAVLPRRTDPELVAWIEARALRTDRGAAVGLLRDLGDFELGPALSGAGVPVRVIDAAESEPAADVEQNSRLADFDALTMDGVGHFPMLEAPREFQALLERWIAELGPRPETTPR